MKAFAYSKVSDAEAAVQAVAGTGHAHGNVIKFIGGGTNLIDLMREGVEQPDTLVDINALPLASIEATSGGGLRIGALAKNTRVAEHRTVREQYPVLSQALLGGASPQLRNMATVGGNLMQRTRCTYFYDQASPCNKRVNGRGCSALEGFNRIHAILGTSESCIATNPSDMCVAFTALDAQIRVQGPNGERVIPIEEFHRLPGDTPHLDTNLASDELIISVDVAALPFASRSVYLKVRDRASYAFAIVSVAAALDIHEGTVRDVRIALGGVAHKPWRAKRAEALLKGSPATTESFRRAAEAELQDAVGYEHNAFKIELAKRTITRALKYLANSNQDRGVLNGGSIVDEASAHA